MKWQEYLKSIMTDAQIEQLKEALQEGKVIEVTGPQVATGKSTLVQILHCFGYFVFEPHAVESIVLTTPIEHMKTGLVDEMLCRQNEFEDWLQS